ncbi:hypothetical protein OYT95_38890 (plasmid) [Rhodococcus sp. JS3073]|nr:hypothetical protein [Rhodococcus sp. JS3073]WAM19631.1 hypothetical protein OYT95_38890 [Rhodococcus sp. JS3073]
MRQTHRHGVHHPDEVCVHGVDESCPAIGAGNWQVTGDGDDDIEASESSDPVVDRSAQALTVANIDKRRHNCATPFLHLRDRPLELVHSCQWMVGGIDPTACVDSDDVGPGGSQPDGVAASWTAGGAGNEGDLTFEPPHWDVSCSVATVVPSRGTGAWRRGLRVMIDSPECGLLSSGSVPTPLENRA